MMMETSFVSKQDWLFNDTPNKKVLIRMKLLLRSNFVILSKIDNLNYGTLTHNILI